MPSATKRRSKRDEIFKAAGWTHRIKNTSRYLKLYRPPYTYEDYLTFTDQEGQFHAYYPDKVVEL